MQTPKVLALHDMVSLGRCSLTVVIPALSAMGVKVCPLPTAVLSSDTGGFGPVFARDLSHEMEGILQKIEGLRPSFGAVYSGYLGSPEQAALVLRAMESFPGLHLVDPVMGDMGTLYQNITGEMVAAMRRLCQRADLITPNLTEAAFLLKKPMPKGDLSKKEAKELLLGLLELGAGTVVVTSAALEGEGGQIATLLGEKAGCRALLSERIDAHYPGTGDVFASVLLGALLQGEEMREAVGRAAAFVRAAVEHTRLCGAPAREGVLLEEMLPLLYGKGMPGASKQRMIEL
jgi:pyridoxine kinase